MKISYLLIFLLLINSFFSLLWGNVFKNMLDYDIEIGYKANLWGPFGSLDEDRDPFDFKTEGLSTASVIGNISFRSHSFLEFDWDLPLMKTEHQKEIIKYNKEENYGIEKYTIGVKLDPFVDLLFKDDSKLNKYLFKPFFSLKFRKTKRLFYGSAKAIKDFVYIPLDATFNYNTHTINGIQNFYEGDSLTFRTEYDYFDVTIKILTFNAVKSNGTISFSTLSSKENTKANKKKSIFKFVPFELRAGYFYSKWNRPSDSGGGLFTYNDKLVVHDAIYKTQGGMLLWTPVNRTAEGWNVDIHLKWGFDNQIDSKAVDYFKHVFCDSLVNVFVGFKLSNWWNYNLNFLKFGNFFLSFGFILELTSFNIEDHSESNESKTKEEDNDYPVVLVDKEMWFDAFLNLSFRF